MKDIFLNLKPVKALVKIRQKRQTYATELSREIDTTYSHMVNTLSKLEKEGLIETEKKGRKKTLPDSESDWLIFALSSFLFIAGMVFGSSAIASQNLTGAVLGIGILLSGYFIAHYELTEKVV